MIDIGVDGTQPLYGRGLRVGGPRLRCPVGVYLGRAMASHEIDVFIFDAIDGVHVDIAGYDCVSPYRIRGADEPPWKSVEQLAGEGCRWAIQTMDLVAKFEAVMVGLGQAIARFAERGAS